MIPHIFAKQKKNRMKNSAKKPLRPDVGGSGFSRLHYFFPNSEPSKFSVAK